MATSRIAAAWRACLLTLAAGLSTLSVPALAQQAAPAAPADLPASPDTAEQEDIVVTGTSIRGAAPVGSNVVAVGRKEIESTSAQTVQQILRTIPSITGSGATPQGGNPGNSFYAPTIHSLGSSSSNSTLVLIDGHRISPGSQQQTLTDPNIVPPIALERVEVLAEGASSVYGSDAVAGVVNFITRRNYKGFEVTGQAGFGDGYRTYNAGALWGTRWDGGWAMLAYNYSRRSALQFADRDFLNRDHRPQGGTNFGSFFCSPASIQPSGVSGIYVSPTATAPIANTAANSPCQLTALGDIFPREERHNAMVKFQQDITDKLTVGLDVVYSRVTNRQQTSRGTITSTVSRTGAQANPFYVNPPGVLPGTTAGDKQTVRFNGDDLLGPGAYNDNNATDYYGTLNLEYKLDGNFRITALGLYGREDSFVGNKGQICASCANLALNGTTNSSGSLTTPSIPGTNIIVTEQPLTLNNALDVWNIGSANRTSAAVRARLIDNETRSMWYYSLTQARLAVDGTLFTIGGGDVRMAIGGEFAHYGLEMNRNRPNNTGPSSRGSEAFYLFLKRNVKSAYAELNIPLVGPGNEMPFLRRFDISLSGRVDDYSEIGTTTNPRIALGWEPTQGIRFRGNYSRSFVAPQLTSVGDVTRNGLTSFSGYGGSNQSLINIPVSRFPQVASVPGVTCSGGFCSVPSTVNGITVNGGPPDPEPGRGISWSIGFDLSPPWLPGFRAGFTLFNTKLINQITGTSASNAISSDALADRLQFFPNGATQADITSVVGDFPLSSPVNTPTYYILSVRQGNVLNLDIQGIDANVDYRIEAGSAGAFRVGGSISYFTRFDQKLRGGKTFSVLNTTGFNNTFPSIQTQARANLGWDIGPVSTTIFANYVGGYRNWSGSTVTPIVTVDGLPSSGGDKVRSNATFDLNLTYTLPGSGSLGGSQIFVDATNLFDREPAFYNSANGYDQYSGNPIGRVITIGLRAKF
jgi:iron complex outermembrane receptor protein